MLVRLFGKNFRSFQGDFELSTVAADLKRPDDLDRGTIAVEIAGMAEPLRLLRVVAIYGPNASGKSTALFASQALRWIALESGPRSRPGSPIPTYQPFLLDKQSQAAPVELGCDVVHKNRIVRYVVKYTRKSITEETLSLIDGKGESALIDRRPDGVIRGALIESSEANRLYVKEMQPNASILSKLAQFGPHKGKESARPYYEAIRSALRFRDYSDALTPMIYLHGNDEEGPSHPDRFADDTKYRNWIMQHLIRGADVGIRDVQVHREPIQVSKEMGAAFEKYGKPPGFPDSAVIVSFIHDGREKQPIDFWGESSGTRKLFNLAGDWWVLGNKSGTLFADELSAGLHPRLLDRLVRAVNDAPDKVKSQLIFATHDTGLLEGQDGLPPALRRDQVYFTRKDGLGATELYSLAEFKEEARPVHNIRKRYMSGLYGAIPDVERLSL